MAQIVVLRRTYPPNLPRLFFRFLMLILPIPLGSISRLPFHVVVRIARPATAQRRDRHQIQPRPRERARARHPSGQRAKARGQRVTAPPRIQPRELPTPSRPPRPKNPQASFWNELPSSPPSPPPPPTPPPLAAVSVVRALSPLSCVSFWPNPSPCPPLLSRAPSCLHVSLSPPVSVCRPTGWPVRPVA